MKTQNKKPFYISKTLFVNSYKCKKKIWLNKYKPELKEKLSLSAELNISEGHEVEALAIQNVQLNGVSVNDKNKQKAMRDTKKLLAEGVDAIFEATFIKDGLLAQCDILKNNYDGTYDIYEIKSSNSVKDYHKIDTAFQKYLLELCGVQVNKIYVMHLNGNYVFQKNKKVKLNGLFLLEDLTETTIDMQIAIQFNIDEAKKVLVDAMEPDTCTGSKCNNPHQCEFYDYCHKKYTVDSVENLTRLSESKRQKLNDMGVDHIADIPDHFELTSRQAIQKSCALSQEFHFDAERVKSFLSQIEYPCHYLDFEATNRAIPFLAGMRPNQFLVYQASIHKRESLEDVQMTHSEILHLAKTDPRKKIAKYLLSYLETEGSIVVWNASFEKTRIKELAEQVPEYKNELMALLDRFVDLAEVFAQTMVYHHEMEGSSSIKYVLPIMDASITYDNLFIKNGNDSQAYYTKMVNGEFSGEMYENIRKALLEYNTLDTWAMFAIEEKLRTMLNDYEAKFGIVNI